MGERLCSYLWTNNAYTCIFFSAFHCTPRDVILLSFAQHFASITITSAIWCWVQNNHVQYLQHPPLQWSFWMDPGCSSRFLELGVQKLWDMPTVSWRILLFKFARYQKYSHFHTWFQCLNCTRKTFCFLMTMTHKKLFALYLCACVWCVVYMQVVSMCTINIYVHVRVWGPLSNYIIFLQDGTAELKKTISCTISYNQPINKAYSNGHLL